MTRGVFVTGTDTGVGKTFSACVLIHALAARGLHVAAMKPIAAGSDEDTLALMRAAAIDASRKAEVTPVLLQDAIAPHIAAAREKRPIELAPLQHALGQLAASADFVVVEGVGGFAVPLGPALDTVDLARAFALPVVLVVGMRLGCLSHALLTQQAIANAGLAFCGWIANAIDPGMEAAEENVTALRERLHAPLLGRLPYSPGTGPAALAARLDVAAL